MSDPTTMTIEQRDLDYGELASWFQQVSDLEFLRPHEAPNADCWAITDGDETVGMALVEPDSTASTHDDAAWIHRLGVLDDRQGEGYGRALLERLLDEYGSLELEVDARKDANGFYRRGRQSTTGHPIRG